jgi:SAM-dependent methyltransferase
MNTFKKCIICQKDTTELLYAPLQIVRCKVCGLIYRDVCGLESDYYPGLIKYRDNLEDHAKMSGRRRNAQFRLGLLQKVVKSKGKLLDIGFNEGFFLWEAQKNGFMSFGCEPNIYAFNYAKGLGLNLINSSLETAFAELKTKGPYDFISLFHVLEHFENPLTTLAMIRKLIAANGVLIVEVPDIESPVSRIYKWCDARINKEHLFYFNTCNLKSILEKAGFQAIYTKRIVWDGFNRPVLENLIRLPLLSEVYALMRRLKNRFRAAPVAFNPAGESQLWPCHRSDDKKYFLAGFLGRIIFYFNRGDDLYTISRLK